MSKRLHVLILLLALAACMPRGRDEAGARADNAGWTSPPRVVSASASGQGLIVRGRAEPHARVVLRSETGDAFAVAADEEGHFVLRMPSPRGHALFSPETQVGQDAVASPERLLVIQGGQGGLALVRPGAGTIRLDPPPALASVDSDDGVVLISGQAPAGRRDVVVDGARLAVDGSGRWRVRAEGHQPRPLTVDGQTFVWPGPGVQAPSALKVERAGRGWRAVWLAPGEAVQSVWLPDRG